MARRKYTIKGRKRLQKKMSTKRHCKNTGRSYVKKYKTKSHCRKKR